jgi:polyisoprenoid-binding protein YceI
MQARATTLCLLAGLALFAGAARAAPRSLPLDPAHAEIGFRAYAFGIVPIDGQFTRFSGVLTIDSAAPGTCRVDLRVEVASLLLPDEAIRDDVLSGNLLDAAAFPVFTYSGECGEDGIDGTLTLHGVTGAQHLAIARDPPRYRAEGTLRRRAWGITGRPLMCGPTVRIRVSTTISR